MEFDKYKLYGDYHHRLMAEGTDPYVAHMNKVISWIGPGKTIDIGAGDGVATKLLNEKYGGCIGIDDNTYAITLAKAHGIDVKQLSIYTIRCPYIGYFDNAFMGDVIEHLEFPDKALLRVKNILNLHGYLYIATPPAMANGQLHDKYHYREYTPDTLQKFVEQHGFKLVEPITIANVRMYAKFQKIK